MAVQDISGLKRQNTHAHTYGILNRRFIKWATNGFPDEDDLRMWHIPAGAVIHEVTMVIADPEGSTGTIDVGYIDEDDSGNVDRDYFLDGISFNPAAGTTTRSITNTQHEPLKVTEPNVYLTATARTVVNAAMEIHFHVTYTYEGNL